MILRVLGVNQALALDGLGSFLGWWEKWCVLGLVGHLLALVRPSSEPVSLLVHKPEVRRPQEKVQEPQELKYIEEDHILQEHFFDAVVVWPHKVGRERMHALQPSVSGIWIKYMLQMYIVTIVKIIDIKGIFSLEISRIKIAPKYIATAAGKCV